MSADSRPQSSALDVVTTTCTRRENIALQRDAIGVLLNMAVNGAQFCGTRKASYILEQT